MLYVTQKTNLTDFRTKNYIYGIQYVTQPPLSSYTGFTHSNHVPELNVVAVISAVINTKHPLAFTANEHHTKDQTGANNINLHENAPFI